MTEIPIEGTEPSDGTEYMSWKVDSYNSGSEDNSWYYYHVCIKDFNTKCNQLLDLAIANDNKEIAKKLLLMFKEDIILTPGNRYEHSLKSKDAATAKYEAAFGKD